MEFREGKVLEKVRAAGREFVFRFPSSRDAEGCREFVNSLVEEGAKILAVRKFSLKEEKEWLGSRIRNGKEGLSFTVVVECGRVIGVGEISKRATFPSAADHTAEISFGIYRKFRRLGIGERLARMLIRPGKEAWDLNIVRSSYVEGNKASERLHRTLGFRRAGKIPRGAAYGGRYFDEILVVKEI
jgi:L-amino acid N-acyltransferase YncA